MMENVQARIAEIKTHKDLSVFIGELYEDFLNDGDSWENHKLDRFLEALAAWTNDMDGYYKNIGSEVPTEPKWGTFANMLVAATMYE
jgi:hypothetical protein